MAQLDIYFIRYIKDSVVVFFEATTKLFSLKEVLSAFMQSVQEADSEEESAQITTSKQSFSFDTVIVFGQGPVKPVLLENELTPKQLQKWQAYKNDPTHAPEPEFWLMQQPRSLAEIEKIYADKYLTTDQKSQQVELIRQRWQRTGWFAMKHWCRQNALAAGLALYKGMARRIILSGGKTIRKDFKAKLPPERIVHWPSEAQLMAEVIRSTYGDLYLKKYGQSIDEKILIEDASTNTLENFACTVNKYPELLNVERKVGFLAVEHHLDRVAMFGKLFSIQGDKLCAQKMLKSMSIDSEISTQETKTYIQEADKFVEDVEIVSQEKRWRKGIQEPEYVKYWLGYVALVKHPKIMHNVMKRLQTPDWLNHADKAFTEVGLDMKDYKEKDLEELAKTDAVKFNYLMQKLQELRKPEYRILPPQLNTEQ